MKLDTSMPLIPIAIAFVLTACADSEKASTGAKPASPPHPAIAAVLSEAPPEGAVSVVAARKAAKPGEAITIEGIIAGTMSPFAEGFASVVVSDLAVETCDKVPGDSCPTPWDACCADPDVLKGMRLTLQVTGEDGRPVAQSLKAISGLKEMDKIVAEGTVATSSTPENLVMNVTRLHRTAGK
jgi:hypothetical protein